MLDSQINWNDLFQKMTDIYPGKLECNDDKLHIYSAYKPIEYVFDSNYDRPTHKLVSQFRLVPGPMDLIGVLFNDGTELLKEYSGIYFVSNSPWAILMLACGRI